MTERWIEQKFARKPAVLQANLAAFNAGWSFGETTELLDVQYRVPAGDRRRAGHIPQRQRHDRAVAGADRRERPQPAAARARELPDHAGLRAAARALAAREVRRQHDPGRGRDRRRRDGARRRVRRPPGCHRHERPGDGSQGRDDRAGGGAGAADDHRRRAARRTLDRDADEDRAVGPADGAVRPPRRVAAAGDRAEHARELLRRGVRGREDRDPLPDPGDRALGHVPGLLLGAVAGARRGRPARDRSCLRRRGRRARPRRSSCPTHATSGWRAPGRCRARPGSSTGSAGSRRPTAPATSPTTRPTTRG